MDGLRINPGTIGTAAHPEHRAGVRRARRGRQGPALDALRLGRDRRRHQRHHAPDADDSGSVQAGFGSFDTTSASFSAGIGGDEAVEASIAGSWIDSGGFPTRAGDTIDRGYEDTSFTAVGAAPARARSTLGLRAWYAEGTSEYSDFFVRRWTRTSRIRPSR